MNYHYVGSELDLFATAAHWKRYVGRFLRPFIRGKVLEVGAGLGGNLPFLHNSSITEWHSLEPDPALAQRLAAIELPCASQVITGTLADLDATLRYDTLLYIDVLEHIEDDRAELVAAVRRLNPAGQLIILAPAHMFLYSAFDKAIGHHRRYTESGLKALSQPDCEMVGSWMLDSVGFFASLANRLVLRSSHPTAKQIALWDRLFVPLSVFFDRLTGHRFGKTVVVVWRRVGPAEA